MDSFWSLFGSGIGKGLSLIAGIFVAKLLGSEVYGEYGTIRTTLVYLAIVSTFGFGYTATKFVAELYMQQSHKLRSLISKLLLFTIGFSGILAILFCAFANEISIVIKAPDLADLLRNFSILIVLNALVSTQIAILSGLKKFKSLSNINIWSGVVVFIASVILTYTMGINGALIALLLSFVVQAIYSQIIIHRALPVDEFGNSVYKICDFRPIIIFSIPIALQESLYTVVHWATLWLLITFSNFTQVGISSAGALWQSMVIFIPSMLKNVMFSYFTTSDKKSNLRGKLIWINLFSSAVPVIIIILFSGLIAHYYGKSFIGLQPVIAVSVISSIFICVSEVYCYELISDNHQWRVFISRLIRDSLIILFAFIVFLNIDRNQALNLAIISLAGNAIYLLTIRWMALHQ